MQNPAHNGQITPKFKRKILHTGEKLAKKSFNDSSPLFVARNHLYCNNQSDKSQYSPASPVDMSTGDNSGFATPQSSNSNFNRTPMSLLGSGVKKRLEICDNYSEGELNSDFRTPLSSKVDFACKKSGNGNKLEIFDFDPEVNEPVKLNDLDELKQLKFIPNCMVAVGFLYDYFISNNKTSSSVRDLPDFFGYYALPNIAKSFKRLKSELDSLLNNLEIQATCIDLLKNEKLIEAHLKNGTFSKDDVCDLCFCSDNSETFSTSDLEKYLQKFYCSKIKEGLSLDEIEKIVNEVTTSVASKHLFSNVQNNLSQFQNHLDEQSAYLYYGSKISHRQIELLDHNLFCKKLADISATEMLTKLPSLTSFNSEIIDFSQESIFSEYQQHIEKFSVEPNFTTLGDKFKLIGIRGGKKRSGLFAQTIVLTKLLELKDVDSTTFNELYQIFVDGFRKRAKFDQFQIVNDQYFPRLPCKQKALKQLQDLADDGLILLGESQFPQTIKIVDPITSVHKKIVVHSRKIGFSNLREFTLNKHISKGFLRAQDLNSYLSLSREECLDRLEFYGVLDLHGHESHEFLEISKLQSLIKSLESKRHISIWFDHSTLGNLTHIMFNFQVMYNRMAYKCPLGVTERQLQYEVEAPQTYFLGMSRSDTASERSFGPMRIDDIMSLSTPIQKNGIVFKDVHRMLMGDNPCRCSESGQNKSGKYHCSNLPIHIDHFDSFRELVNVEHQSIEMLRNSANKGDFFKSSDNKNLNLQKINSREFCETLKIGYSDAREAQQLHEKALCGRQGLPLLLQDNPYTPLEDLNLENYEIMPVEPLHDVKGVVKKSFEHIPGSIHIVDENIIKIIHSIVHKSGDELFLLREKHSAEDLAKSLIDISFDLQNKFFPHGFSAPCGTCGHIFTMSRELKCVKCIFVGYYRTLAEIQVHAYKDESKRNAHEVLRLHTLVYLLFYFLQSISYVHSRFDINDVIRSTWFINTIYYLPLAYEITNLLTINAGRCEDRFKQVKFTTKNLSNNQYQTPELLLNAIRRLEANRHYNHDSISKNKISMFSKKVTSWLKECPPPPVTFTKEFIVENKDIPSLLWRISNYIVSSHKSSYFEVQDEFISIPYKSCSCFVANCTICTSKRFPPFGINNIHTSNIKKVIDVKIEIFNTKIKPFIFTNDKIDFDKLVTLVQHSGNSLQNSENIVLNNPHTSYASKIIDKTVLETCNEAKVKLKTSFQRIIVQLNEPLDKMTLLKNTNMARCIAKIYGDVSTEVVMLDKASGVLEGIQNKHRNNKKAQKYDECYHEALRDYISHIRKHIHKLRSFAILLQEDIKSLSDDVDKIYTADEYVEDHENNTTVKKLRYHQKRYLALNHTVNILLSESTAHSCISTDYDEGLF